MGMKCVSKDEEQAYLYHPEEAYIIYSSEDYSDYRDSGDLITYNPKEEVLVYPKLVHWS